MQPMGEKSRVETWDRGGEFTAESAEKLLKNPRNR